MEQGHIDRRQLVPIMIAMMLSLLLAALDNTIVGTAMPKIIEDLQGMEHYNWPFTAYILISTIAIPIAGKLSDVLGRKPIFLTGLLSFLLGSILCGVSTSMLQLILFRGLQGAGGGIIISNSFILVGDFFPPRERGKYMGIIASMFGVASVVGPVVGGFITDLLNWRWVFFVNIPLGIVSVILIILLLPRKTLEKGSVQIDYPGAIFLTAGMVPFLLLFTWGGTTYSWFSPQIIGMFLFAVVCLLLFFRIERRAAEPIIPLNFFREKIFVVSSVIMFISNAVLFCGAMYVPLFLQGVLGISPSAAGSIITPMMLSIPLSAIVVGRLIARDGKYKRVVLVGFLLNGIGTAMLMLMHPDTSVPYVIVASTLFGLGGGVVFPVFNVVPQAAFPHTMMGTVTGAIQFFRNMGGAIGTSVFGSIMAVSMHSRFAILDFSRVPETLRVPLTDPNTFTNEPALSALRQRVPAGMHDLFEGFVVQAQGILVDSLRLVFFVCLLLVVLMFVIMLFQKERRLR